MFLSSACLSKPLTVPLLARLLSVSRCWLFPSLLSTPCFCLGLDLESASFALARLPELLLIFLLSCSSTGAGVDTSLRSCLDPVCFLLISLSPLLRRCRWSSTSVVLLLEYVFSLDLTMLLPYPPFCRWCSTSVVLLWIR